MGNREFFESCYVKFPGAMAKATQIRKGEELGRFG
jgi:hypothetical protein